MAINKLDTGAIQDNAITNAKMADDAVGVADLAATGTPSNTTFLRGDNAWATPTDTNTTYSVQDGELSQNNFTNDDHTKLNNIEASATADQTNDEIKAAVEAASDSNTFTDADHTKLNAIATSANNYVHPNHSGDVVSAADGAMTIQTDAVDIAMLSATGTPGNTTFLRGDNAWATAGSTSASDLTSGTLPMARLSGTLPALNGSALTNLPSDVTVSSTAPSSPSAGDMWFDSTSTVKAMKVWSGASWDQMSNKFLATGGTVTTSGNYTIHTFLSSGNFVVSSGGTVDVLVVAGGGSGGSGNGGSGGGGAGGFRQIADTTVSAQTYTITVGAGGAAQPGGQGNDGSNSAALGYTSIGGGGGGRWHNVVGRSGGSGGGGGGAVGTGGAGTSGQGNAGGDGRNSTSPYSGGGGGGAGAVGQTAATNELANGGVGLASSYSGSSVYYAGGGGAGCEAYSGSQGQGGNGGGGLGGTTTRGVGGAATANTGGGGGGGGYPSQYYLSGAGGSGIVIIRYLT